MDQNLVRAAASQLGIQAILLRSSQVRADDALLPPTNQDLAVVAQYRAAPVEPFEIIQIDQQDTDVTLVVFRFATGIRLLDQATQASTGLDQKDSAGAGTIRLEILAEFAAHYRLRQDANIENLRPALAEFGRCNVGFHVWPYWREYVQATCARLGIPAISIGMYRLPDESEAHHPA